MKDRFQIRYIVELVLTLLMILFITAVLVRMFTLAADRSDYARALTESVRIAGNIAELSEAAGSPEALREMAVNLDDLSPAEESDAFLAETAPGGEDEVTVFLAKGGDDRSYLVSISWKQEYEGAGTYSREEIRVAEPEGTEPLYTLYTEHYEKEGAAE